MQAVNCPPGLWHNLVSGCILYYWSGGTPQLGAVVIRLKRLSILLLHHGAKRSLGGAHSALLAGSDGMARPKRSGICSLSLMMHPKVWVVINVSRPPVSCSVRINVLQLDVSASPVQVQTRTFRKTMERPKCRNEPDDRQL